MPAPQPQACQCAQVLNGQASYKPRGRKPRYATPQSRKAVALWGFEFWFFRSGETKPLVTELSMFMVGLIVFQLHLISRSRQEQKRTIPCHRQNGTFTGSER